jgi:hypothetical protein
MFTCNLAEYSDRLAALEINLPQMTTEKCCMQNHSRTPVRKTSIDKTLDRAVQRVYAIYGSNLTRFFVTVRNEQRHMQECAEMRRDDIETEARHEE